MNNNQTPVESFCLDVQEQFTNWIYLSNIMIIVGFNSSIALLAISMCNKATFFIRKAKAKNMIDYFFIIFTTVLVIWSQFILYTEKAIKCAENFHEVKSLRYVPLFWAILNYVLIGCMCCLFIINREF